MQIKTIKPKSFKGIKYNSIVNLTTSRYQKLSKHCGQHSGFPKCCVDFFCNKWHFESRDQSKFFFDYWKLMHKYPRCHYIPCPKCLKNKTFVKVKSCPKDCMLKTFLFGKNWWKFANQTHQTISFNWK